MANEALNTEEIDFLQKYADLYEGWKERFGRLSDEMLDILRVNGETKLQLNLYLQAASQPYWQENLNALYIWLVREVGLPVNRVIDEIRHANIRLGLCLGRPRLEMTLAQTS